VAVDAACHEIGVRRVDVVNLPGKMLPAAPLEADR
jgi:hypothetical protein